MVKTYDPKSMAIIIGGKQASGFADGTFLNVEFDEDAFGLTVGADGEGMRAKSNNKSATITLTLLPTSDYNRHLSDLAQADEDSNSGVVPVLIKDGSGRDLHSAESAWIQKRAAAEYSREGSPREWTLRTDNLQSFLGGN